MVSQILLTPLVQDAYDHLDATPNLTVYLIDVPTAPPTISTEDRRVRPYALFLPIAGLPTDELDQGDTVVDLDYGWQIQCVAGRPADLMLLVDVVRGRMDRYVPGAADTTLATGPARQINSLATPIKDPDYTPTRYFIPLVYTTLVGR